MNTENLKPFERDLVDTLLAIEKCIEERRHMPTKILIYSLMDSMAWACSPKIERATRKNFETWVQRWMMPRFAMLTIQVRPVDLYAARCAVLHSMTPNSELSRGGNARTIAYAWGRGKVEDLRHALAGTGVSDVVALHYDDLLDVLRNAIADCLSEADTDADLRQLLQSAAEQHYVYVSCPPSGAENLN